MSEAKFTKGAWSAEFEGAYHSVWSDNGNPVVFIHNEDGKVGFEESQSNAHLIAAAPEMYEYIDGLYKTIGLNGGAMELDEHDFEYLGKLLAKARGESC